IEIAGGSGTIVNAGSIQGSINETSGGSVANTGAAAVIAGDIQISVSGAVTNAGTIRGAVREFGGGSVANTSVAAVIAGDIQISGSGAVINAGTIRGAVREFGGGAVANLGSTASIESGSEGVYIRGANAAVDNAGRIVAGDNAVRLNGG